MSRDLTPIHPDLRSFARVLPSGGPSTSRQLRMFRKMLAATGREKSGKVEVLTHGSIRLRVHRPPSTALTPQPAMLWIHGGGFIMGTAAADDMMCREWVRRLGVTVVAPDYRLAPEHPFPTPLHDCHDALEWLAAQDDVDETRIGIGGGSAGGGLAAALALLARERGVVDPLFQLLLYPMLDDRTATRTDIDETGQRLWNNRSNAFAWRAYLDGEPGSDAVDAFAAPSRHADLDGLPPAWIGVGTADLFHEEDMAYAARLADAGVPVETTVVDGAFHAFNLARRAPVVKEFERSMFGAMAAGLGVPLLD